MFGFTKKVNEYYECKKKNILTDDDDLNTLTLNALLTSRGYQCIIAESGKKGLEKLQQNNDIGIAVSDMIKAELDGFQLIKR